MTRFFPLNPVIYVFELVLLKIKLPRKKSVLILKLDAIGDYVIFRNFVAQIKHSKRFMGYEICLATSNDVKDLVEKFDRKFLTAVFYVDRVDIVGATICRLKFLFWVLVRRFELVIHPTYSREFYSGDLLVNLTGAEEKIGFRGDTLNISEENKGRGDCFYTSLYDCHTTHEFDRQKEFVSWLLRENITLDQPRLEYSVSMKHDTVGIFLGAGSISRRWTISGYSNLLHHLLDTHKKKVILLGGSDCTDFAKCILEQVHCAQIQNNTGRQTLSELAESIASLELLISHDSVGIHLGVATLCPALVCISIGNLYGRFVPYPHTHSAFAYVLPPQATTMTSQQRSEKFSQGSNLSMADISVADVLRAVDAILSE